jgi:hypothetical protein
VFRGGGLSDGAPLILTLRLDADHQALFDRLRDRHFPADRNHLAAHVTLFHALPGAEAPGIAARLAEVACASPQPELQVAAPYSLGRGVAFRLVSPAAEALRGRLALDLADRLTVQDRTKRSLHVTVQNKVSPAAAKALLAELSPGFAPSRFASPGLDLWRYLGGPWSHLAAFDFAASSPFPARGRGQG